MGIWTIRPYPGDNVYPGRYPLWTKISVEQASLSGYTIYPGKLSIRAAGGMLPNPGDRNAP